MFFQSRLMALAFFLLFASAAIAGNCPDEDTHNDYWDVDGEALFEFTNQIVKAVENRDSTTLVGLIDGELAHGPRKQYLLSHGFDAVFPESFTRAVIDGGPTCTWFNANGTMLGNSRIWINRHSSNSFYISAITGYNEEQPRYSLSAGWPIGDSKIIHPKSFVVPWESSDNFEEFCNFLKIDYSNNLDNYREFRDNIGLYQAKIPERLEPSWCEGEDTCAPVFSRHRISQGRLIEKPAKTTQRVFSVGKSEGRGFFEFALLGKISLKKCQSLAPGFKGRCVQSYLVRIVENSGGSACDETIGIYGVFTFGGENADVLVPLKFFDSEAAGLNYLDSDDID